MTIPFFKPVSGEVVQLSSHAIARVVESNWFVLGAEVEGFEREFAQYCGAPNCVSVANGSDALELALRALGVGRGDKVLMVSNAGFYASVAAYACGAVPVYVDVEYESLTLDPEQVEQAIVPGVKAIIVTHLYGRLAKIEDIVEVARRRGVAVIEDCAQAHGAERGGRKAGMFGDIGCFSFYPTKNLGAVGDGGCVVTGSSELAAAVRQLRQYGWGRKYQVERSGGRNSRLDEMQAAVLRVRLPFLDSWNGRRREIANRYSAELSDLPLRTPGRLQSDHVAHLYVIRCDERDRLRSHLAESGIASDIHYPIADHRQTVSLGTMNGARLPVSELACSTVLSLPCFPGLLDAEVDLVISAVRDFFSKG